MSPAAACAAAATMAAVHRVQEVMRPLAAAATMLPPAAFRQDLGVARTALLRYLPQLLSGGPAALKLTGPFSKVGGWVGGGGVGWVGGWVVVDWLVWLTGWSG